MFPSQPTTPAAIKTFNVLTTKGNKIQIKAATFAASSTTNSVAFADGSGNQVAVFLFGDLLGWWDDAVTVQLGPATVTTSGTTTSTTTSPLAGLF